MKNFECFLNNLRYVSFLFLLISFFVVSFSKFALSSDKELLDKLIKNAITTIVLEKFNKVSVGKKVDINIEQVFPSISGNFKLKKKNNCVANWKTTESDCYP